MSKAIVDQLNKFKASQQKALDGLSASESIANLPEPFKTQMQTLVNEWNAALKGMEPLDQIPAAGDAAASVSWFADCLGRIQGYAAELNARLASAIAMASGSAKEMAGMQKKITDGEFVAKAVHQTALDAATEHKKTNETLSAGLRNLHVRLVELAGLPAAPDEVLGLPSDQFLARQATATGNREKLKENGCEAGGKGAALIAAHVWKDQKAFDGVMAEVKDLLPGKAAATPPAREPFKGGSETGTPAAKTEMVCC